MLTYKEYDRGTYILDFNMVVVHFKSQTFFHFTFIRISHYVSITVE